MGSGWGIGTDSPDEHPVTSAAQATLPAAREARGQAPRHGVARDVRGIIRARMGASEMDDGARQGARDTRDGLDPGQDEPAEAVDAVGLGAHDDVVGTGDILGE